MTGIWAGAFGDDYSRRNFDIDTVRLRRPLWETLWPRDCDSVLEIGANVGHNLDAIGQFTGCELYACEPNDLARETMIETLNLPRDNVTADYADHLSFADGKVDMVISCGVLIHVPPDRLEASMREMHRVARRWIIIGEYFAPSEEMVPYRGHADMLWRRDYGSLFLDAFPDLSCTGYVFAWKRMTGLDNITFWRLEKGRKPH